MIKYKKNIGYANRGMFLEHIINNANTYYLSKDIAIIYKKPTPIKVLNVAYRSSKTTLIDKAVFSETSTLDYNGVYKGKYIEFDAKECKNSTSFPLSNIKPHQIEHIKNIMRHNGIVFLIIFMNNKFYLLKGDSLISFIDNNDRKSIPYDYIEEKGYIIKEGYMPRIDYIKAIDEAYLKEEK
ncbi:MAG: Holliday junction resolvase RecU [Tenericutes bacterium]|nr:Holliday junction resolvase RecU [Mycoplasmatota bacterium]